jgi:tetratricopeptide (TPR) repeat protein
MDSVVSRTSIGKAIHQQLREKMTLSKDAYEWNKKANRLLQNGQHQEAFEAYKKSIRYDPVFVEPWANLGRLLASTGNHEKAERCYLTALRIDPDHWWAMTAYAAYIMTLENRWNEAEMLLQKAVKLEPDNAKVWCTLGVLFTDVANEQAESAFRRALEIDSEDRNSRLFFAIMLVLAERYQEAENLARSIIESNQSDLRAWALLARTLYAQARLREGIRAQERVVELGNNEMDHWWRLSQMYIEGGYLKQAEYAIQRSLNLRPDFVDGWEQLVEVYNEMGREKDASSTRFALSELFRVNPDAMRDENGFLIPRNRANVKDA